MTYRLPNTAKQVIVIILVAAVLIMPAASGMAFDEINKTSFGVAIKGYDTVAYHTENRAVQGKSEFSHTWADAKWYFASAKNRDLFVADPERYAPQYGGY
jgi:YHS domain-containing protein